MAAAPLEILPIVKQLSPRVIRILGLNPSSMTLQGTNTYIVGTGNNRILIDTGSPDKHDYIQLLKETLNDVKVTLERVIITHWHHDHIGGVKEVWQLNSDNRPLVSKLARPHPFAPPPSPPTYEYLLDGQIISTKGATLRVIATPGHTDDHLSLYMEEENAIFSGDCILGQGTAVFEDLKDYMESLNKLKLLSPSLIYPGHGPLITDALATIETYINHRMTREKQILNVLKEAKKGMTPLEIVGIIYKDTTPKNLWEAAKGNVILHLKKLEKENQIISEQVATDTFWSVKN